VCFLCCEAHETTTRNRLIRRGGGEDKRPKPTAQRHIPRPPQPFTTMQPDPLGAFTGSAPKKGSFASVQASQLLRSPLDAARVLGDKTIDRASRMQEILRKLSLIHGEIRVSSEANGRHFNLTCPSCYEKDPGEVRKKHLSINIDRYFDLEDNGFSPLPAADSWQHGVTPRKKIKGYAQCMKESRPYSLGELLAMPPLSERGEPSMVPRIIEVPEAITVIDDYGRRVPLPPGDVVGFHQLPSTHPAIQYVIGRGYDPQALWQQFRCSWCIKPTPEDKENGIYYSNLGMGWQNTTHGRIIFYSMIGGSKACWQARYVDIDQKVWHPVFEGWHPLPDFGDRKLLRYITSWGKNLRNQQLCGWDHVVQFSRDYHTDFCVITEGPLDAARFPSYGLALLGKYMSPQQAEMLRNFRRVVTAFDLDTAGFEACERAKTVLAGMGIQCLNFWDGFEFREGEEASKLDVGNLTYARAHEQLMKVTA
jgi:hypothetical protein